MRPECRLESRRTVGEEGREREFQVREKNSESYRMQYKKTAILCSLGQMPEPQDVLGVALHTTTDGEHPWFGQVPPVLWVVNVKWCFFQLYSIIFRSPRVFPTSTY